MAVALGTLRYNATQAFHRGSASQTTQELLSQTPSLHSSETASDLPEIPVASVSSAPFPHRTNGHCSCLNMSKPRPKGGNEKPLPHQEKARTSLHVEPNHAAA